MPITPEARERLSRIMEDRRLDLGLSWREVASRAEVSYEALRALRTGTGGIRPLTARQIDSALEWVPGSVQAIMDGGDPEDLFTPDEREELEKYKQTLREGYARQAARESDGRSA